MLNFRPVSPSDREWMTAYYQKRDFPGAQYTFASCRIWEKGYDVQVAEQNGFLFIRYRFTDPLGCRKTSYRAPMGEGDDAAFKEAVEDILRDSRSFCSCEPVMFQGIPQMELERMQRLYGDKLRPLESRGIFEYIYRREDLLNLSGPRFHGKRGYINRFMRTPWEYRPMTPDLIPAALQLERAWEEQNEQLVEEEEELSFEVKAARFAIREFESLGLMGGVLFQEGEPVAYTLGEPVNGDTFAVHFEKALYTVAGAYPMVTWQFVQQMDDRFLWVNREEDTGDEGLRRAKESWHPDHLLPLYNAELSG